RAAIMHAVGDVLAGAAGAPAKAVPDVGPLFDLLRAYGGPDAVSLLERSVPQWGEYALIALAGVPDGAGIPSLTALARSADVRVANAALPFQILAQAASQHAEAGC